MRKVISILGATALAALLMSCNSRSGRLKEIKDIQAKAVEKYKAEHDINSKGHNIVIRFIGNDKEIPKDGQLLVIKCSLEDTLIVAPASLDDCARILENNGRG